MENESIDHVIERDPWLRPIFAQAPRHLVAQMELVVCEPETRIITKGESNPFIFILYRGTVRIVNEFGNNRIFSFATREAPCFSGLLELLSEQDIATSSVETLRQSRFIRIRKRLFSLWMDEDIQAFRLVVKIFAKQLYPSLFSMGAAYVYPKYRNLVDYLVRNHGSRAIAEGEAVVPGTRDDLADELGFSHRTVYRLCRRLKEDGFAGIRKKKLVLEAGHVGRMQAYLESETYERLT